MLSVEKITECMWDLECQLDHHADAMFRALSRALELEELEDDVRRELAYTLHFDGGMLLTMVVRLLSTNNDESRVVAGWLDEEGKRRQIQSYKDMPYTAYLDTSHWKARRRRALMMDGCRCRVCNSSDNLNVHHRTYDRIGEEQDSDLTTLCRTCHEMFHTNLKIVRPA